MASSAVPAEGRERIVPVHWYNSRFAAIIPHRGGKHKRGGPEVDLPAALWMNGREPLIITAMGAAAKERLLWAAPYLRSG